MSFNCRECGEEFPTQRSLHAHIKKHDMLLGDYYVKHFQRKNKLTGELLPFKNVDDYFDKDFSQPHQLSEWIEKAPFVEAKEYLGKLLKRRIDKLGLDYGPSELELVSAGLPSVDVYKRFFGSYTDACKWCGVMPHLGKPMPREFWNNHSNTGIFIDTREQRPLSFNKSKYMKLDVGDYAPYNEYFDYTFVDRKGIGDFCSTVTVSYNRFCRELDRCREIGCYLFVVIEAPFDKMEYYSKNGPKKWNLTYVFNKMRQIQMEYHDCCQFVFGGRRGDCAHIIPKLLVMGKKLWNTDVNYFWQKHLNTYELGTGKPNSNKKIS